MWRCWARDFGPLRRQGRVNVWEARKRSPLSQLWTELGMNLKNEVLEWCFTMSQQRPVFVRDMKESFRLSKYTRSRP